MKTKRKIAFVYCLLIGTNLLAQKDAALSKDWRKEERSVDYKKESKYKGPEDWFSSGPENLESSPDEFFESEEGNNLDGIISQNRSNEARKSGTEKIMKKPKEIKIPEFDPPEIDDPDVDLDMDVPDPNKVSKSTWRSILFILIFVIVIALLYFWLKKLNFTSKINQQFDENWNPEVVTKSELESRLENALNQEQYREAIRVYYTFILQELIRLKLINWRLEKTNQQYINELKKAEFKSELIKCTRYFDIVWYGEYNIDKTKFNELQPHFTRFIQSLKAIKDE